VSVRDMIFNEEVFFDSKPTKIIIELMTTLNEVIDLIEVSRLRISKIFSFGKTKGFQLTFWRTL